MFPVSHDDYSAPMKSLRFPPCTKQQCVDINITDDSISEPQESFTLNLMRSDGMGDEIQLEPDVAEIIIDNDGILMLYQRSCTVGDDIRIHMKCTSLKLHADAIYMLLNLLNEHNVVQFVCRTLW